MHAIKPKDGVDSSPQKAVSARKFFVKKEAVKKAWQMFVSLLPMIGMGRRFAFLRNGLSFIAALGISMSMEVLL